MLKIRLQRKGRKKMPVFRLVVAEHTMPTQGRYVEKLGSFVGGRRDETLTMKEDRVKHWLSVGAQPSQTVARLLVEKGIKEAQKFIKDRQQKPSNAELNAAKEAEEKAKAEAEAAEAAAAAEAEAAQAEESTEEAPAEEAKEEEKAD